MVLWQVDIKNWQSDINIMSQVVKCRLNRDSNPGPLAFRLSYWDPIYLIHLDTRIYSPSLRKFFLEYSIKSRKKAWSICLVNILIMSIYVGRQISVVRCKWSLNLVPNPGPPAYRVSALTTEPVRPGIILIKSYTAGYPGSGSWNWLNFKTKSRL